MVGQTAIRESVERTTREERAHAVVVIAEEIGQDLDGVQPECRRSAHELARCDAEVDP